MRKSVLIYFLLIVLFFTSVSCSKKEPDLPVFEEKMLVMGTVVNVRIYGETEKKSKKVFHDLLKDFKYMQVAWSPHKNGSLKRINGLIPMLSPFSIGPAFQDMIKTATQLSIQSEGMFNPAIGKLIDLWNFSGDEMPHGPPPEESLIKEILKQNPQMTDLTVGPLSLVSKNKSVSLDFGAFAKGYGVDKAIEYLKSVNVNNAIINAGGDLRAIGSKGGKPWSIGIRHPREQGVIAGIDVKDDESVFTSGDYERFYDYQGKRYHHIIDPRTGYPAEGTTSVTVVHKNAAIADAAATALFVAGPEHWSRIAKKMSVDQVMLIDKAGKIHLTAKMKQRLKFTNPDKVDLVVE
jgi:thiamine biosynthesis lipoprotein